MNDNGWKNIDPVMGKWQSDMCPDFSVLKGYGNTFVVVTRFGQVVRGAYRMRLFRRLDRAQVFAETCQAEVGR